MPVKRPQPAIPSTAVPVANWQPDQPVITDGAVQDAFNYHPVTGGMRTFPGTRVLGMGLPSTCLGFFSGFLVGTPVFAAATGSALYIADSHGNLRPSAVGFTNQVNRWRFAAYGTPTGPTQDLIASNGVDPVQRYMLNSLWQASASYPLGAVITDANGNAQQVTQSGTSGTTAPTWATTVGATTTDNTVTWTLTALSQSGVWSPLPGNPPKAAIVAASDYALVLVLPNSQQFISSFNETPLLWVGNQPLQVYAQSIPQSPGIITAAHRLRNAMVFYKPMAAHTALFVGGTVGWDVQDSSLQQGVLSQEWVINTGDYHYFPSLGGHDFWQYDGYNWTRLPNQMCEFFRVDHNDAFMYRMQGVYDSERELLIWAYSSNSANPAGTLDSWLIYYLRTQTWSFQRLPCDLLMNYLNPATQHNMMGFFGTDHAARVYDDAVPTGRSYVTSNFFGDYRYLYACDSLRVGFGVKPASATVTPINQGNGGAIPPGPPGDYAAMSGALTEPLDDHGAFRFQMPNRSRLQAFQVVTQGMAEIVSIEPSIQYAGDVL